MSFGVESQETVRYLEYLLIRQDKLGAWRKIGNS